jgi:hypothetical protein
MKNKLTKNNNFYYKITLVRMQSALTVRLGRIEIIAVNTLTEEKSYK